MWNLESNLSMKLGIKILLFGCFVFSSELFGFGSADNRNHDSVTQNTNVVLNQKLYSFFMLKWYVDILNNIYISNTIFTGAFSFFFLQLEKGWIEFFGPTGILKLLGVSKNFFLMQLNTFHSFLTFFFVLLSFVCLL